jgi:osmotically-inducible protein OsmY
MKKLLLTFLACSIFATVLPGCVPLVAVGATAGGVMIATDRRTVGTQFDDKTGPAKISFDVNEKYGDKVHVNITSYNGIVLLTGEVPTEAIKQDVAHIAAATERVRAVQNELLVGPLSSLASRSNDTLITGKVKTRFLDSQFSATHVKVVTERGIVYLMGVVNRQEAARATDIARKTVDVRQVIRIFEYQN